MASPNTVLEKRVRLKDRDWVGSSFMLSTSRRDPSKGRLTNDAKTYLYFTTAAYKAANSSLGGNCTINNYAQYTITCDIPRGGLKKVSGSESSGIQDRTIYGGLGRYHSESLDDHGTKVAFRFGVPEYKGLITFFTSFYDGGAAMLGRQGRLPDGIFYRGAKIISSIIALPLTVLVWVAEAGRWLANRPSSRYYNLKPSMALYWQRVNLIANMMAANMGLVPGNVFQKAGIDEEIAKMDPRFNAPNANDWSYDRLRKEYGDMFTKQGGIDVFHVANKYSRMNTRRQEELRRVFASANYDSNAAIKADVDKHVQNFRFRDEAVPGKSMDKYLVKYHQSRLGAYDPEAGVPSEDFLSKAIKERLQATADGSRAGTPVNTTPTDESSLSEGAQVDQGAGPDYGAIGQSLVDDSADDGFIFPVLKDTSGDGSAFEKIGGWASKFGDYMEDVARDGGQWVNFRVDAVGSVSESFSNSVGESELAGKLNGISSSAAAVRFGLSDFNTGIGVIDGVVNSARDIFAGVMDGWQLGGLAALMGAGHIDIPKRWMDSSASLPSSSFVMKCRPPYGHVLSRFMHMHLPLACILAAALPISYGRHSYGAPFLCEMYVPGKNQIRLGMITDVSVSRGEGTCGWSVDGDFLGCDISFEVTDMASVIHAPIDSGMNMLGNFRWIMDDDNVFNDYMAVLSNLSIAEMTYSWEKLKLNWRKYMVTQHTFLSPSAIAMSVGDTSLGRFVRKVTPGQNPITR